MEHIDKLGGVCYVFNNRPLECPPQLQLKAIPLSGRALHQLITDVKTQLPLELAEKILGHPVLNARMCEAMLAARGIGRCRGPFHDAGENRIFPIEQLELRTVVSRTEFRVRRRGAGAVREPFDGVIVRGKQFSKPRLCCVTCNFYLI